MPPPRTLLEQISDKVLVGDDCWLWQGATTRGGYGHLKIKGRNKRAARVLYELLVGPIPAGLTLDHLCRVRLCVHPAHLEPATNAVNVQRAVAATGRQARHGTRSKYVSGCHCAPCSTANRDAQRQKRAERRVA